MVSSHWRSDESWRRVLSRNKKDFSRRFSNVARDFTTDAPPSPFLAQPADMDPRLFEILIPTWQAVRGLTGFIMIALARDPSCQIEHVEFDPGVTQEMGEVPEPFRVL